MINNIFTEIYYNNFIINNDDLLKLFTSNNYLISNWNEINSKKYIDLIFPTDESNDNCWNSLKLRPFKICPINKDKLYTISNNSILNIYVYDIVTNKLIGFIIISNMKKCYWIDILCTNIGNGIGTYLINIIKLFLIDKPIKLFSTYSAEKFYIKNGFIKNINNYFEYYK